MKLLVKQGSALEQKSACLVLGAFEGRLKEEVFIQIDGLTAGAFTRAVKK